MSGTNEILPFASTNTGTNLLTQAEYAADAQRTTGNQPGIARSKLVNKSLRQASLLAAGLAEFIADYQSNNVTDSLTPQNIADYLYAALTGALAVTPPQFDNDTSLATTEFVQRALGNFRGSVQYNGVTMSLTNADMGKVIVLGGGSSNITLPSASSVPIGTSVHIFSQGAAHNIYPAAGERISVGNLNYESVLPISGTDFLTLESYGGDAWLVVNGTPMLRGSSPFSNSLSSAGWHKLPSGMILQWGTINSGAAGAVGLTFPVTFPNGCFTVLPVCGLRPGVTSVDMFGTYSFDRYGAVILGSTNSDTPASMIFTYIALGY